MPIAVRRRMRFVIGAVAVVLMFSGCNPGSSGDAGVDGGASVTRHAVFDSISLPNNNTAAREAAVDLDGDGLPDNQMGMVVGSFATQGFDMNADMKTSVDTGAAIELLSIISNEGNAAVTIRAVPGLNPMPAACTGSTDTVCRHHLDGHSAFTASSTTVTALTGGVTADGGVQTSATGPLTVQISFFGSTVPLVLQHPHVSISSATDAAVTAGVVAGGILESDVSTLIVPAMATGMQAQVTADCTNTTPPECGCTAGSSGKTLLGLVDLPPRDCSITAAEISANSLFGSLLASDVMLDGQPALSFGAKFTAVPATFTLSGE